LILINIYKWLKGVIMKIELDFSLSFVLTIVFFVLKMLNIINWAWVWILSPIWISLILTIIIVIIWKIWYGLN
jgi:hypothetical protein